MRIRIKRLALLFSAGLICLVSPQSCTAAEETAQAQTEDVRTAKNGSENAPNTEGGTDAVDTIGAFTTQDIDGEEYSETMFEDYDLTLVNVFATWCSPCIQEIPELEKLYEEMAEQKVNVVGILLDGTDASGEPVQESLDKAHLIAELSGSTYPFLLPDATWLNGRLLSITAIPHTFFVDSKGQIVGDACTGGRDFEAWKEITKERLEQLEPESENSEPES